MIEAAGVHVRLPLGVADSGRPTFSKGFIGKARSAAQQNVAALAPLVRRDWDVVVVEPSDAVMFQSDYRDLLPAPPPDELTGTVAAGEGGKQPATDGGPSDVELVAENTYGALEYVDRLRLNEDIEFTEQDESLTITVTAIRRRRKKTTMRSGSSGERATRSTRSIRAAVAWPVHLATRPNTSR